MHNLYRHKSEDIKKHTWLTYDDLWKPITGKRLNSFKIQLHKNTKADSAIELVLYI